jgi:hypothetical protein
MYKEVRVQAPMIKTIFPTFDPLKNDFQNLQDRLRSVSRTVKFKIKIE